MTARSFTSAHTNISAGSTTSMTAEVGFICDISFTSLVMDLPHLDTYTLSIDGVDVATVTISGGLGTNSVFTPAAPIPLAFGIHTFKVRGTFSQTWYHNANLQVTGTDPAFGLVGVWQESSNNAPHWTINFDDGGTTLVGAGATPNNVSSSNYAAQSSSFTIDQDLYIYRWFSTINNPDNWALWIDGTRLFGGLTTTFGGQLGMFVPPSPFLVTAGTHTFMLRGTVARKFYYRSDTNKIGSLHLTATTTWVEAGGTTKPQLLMVFDPNISAPPAGAASGVVGFL